MELISREDAIEAITNYAKFLWDNYHETCHLAGMIDAIDSLPTAEPQWTPVTKSLPKNDDWVIVTILDESGDTPWRYTDFGWYLEEANCWIVEAEQRTDVIAWAEMPEPWRGEEDD